jgi:hypothetical protein
MKRLLFLFAAACIPVAEVQKMVLDGKCEVYCHRSGYDSGAYRDKSCLCYDALDFERTKEKRLTLPRRANHRFADPKEFYTREPVTPPPPASVPVLPAGPAMRFDFSSGDGP